MVICYGNKEWESLVMVICYRKGLVLLFDHVKGLVPLPYIRKELREQSIGLHIVICYRHKEWDSLVMVICYRKGLVLFREEFPVASEVRTGGGGNYLRGLSEASRFWSFHTL